MRRRRTGGAGVKTGAEVETVSRADTSSVDELWLETLQLLCARVAHELKGALNGVSVNLEVVRSRSERAESPASSVSPYAKSAAAQLDSVILFSEAMLALTRPARDPIDLGPVVRHIALMLASPGRADGRHVELDPGIASLGTASASGNAARLAVGRSLMAALDSSAQVDCGSVAGALGPAIRISCRDGTRLAVDEDAAAAVAAAGISIEAESDAIVITFPR